MAGVVLRVILAGGARLLGRAAPAVVQVETAAVRTAAATGARVVATETAEVAAATAARTAAETGAKAAAARGLSAFDRVALNSAKTGMVATGYVAADVASGLTLTKDYAIPAVVSMGEALGRIPLAGPLLESAVVNTGFFVLGMLSHGVDITAEAAAQVAERAGFEDQAVAGRVAYFFGTKLLSVGVKIQRAPEAERVNVFLREAESSGISQDDMVRYLSAYPDKVAFLRSKGFDPATALPGLDAAIAARAVNPAQTLATGVTVAPGATTAAFTGAAKNMALDTRIAATKVFYIGSGLNEVFNRVCELQDGKDPAVKLNLGDTFNLVRWVAECDIPIISMIARSIGVGMAAPDMRDRFANFARDAQSGDLLGMTRDATGIEGPGIVAAKPAESRPSFAPDLAPNMG